MSPDRNAQRYAAAEELAKASREALNGFREVIIFIPTTRIPLLDRIETALAEYERTKDVA